MREVIGELTVQGSMQQRKFTYFKIRKSTCDVYTHPYVDLHIYLCK